MSRQSALLLALAAVAAAGALISFGSWILLRRNRPRHPAADADDEPAT